MSTDGFWRGWKRKVGGATLLLALIFAFCWVRSQSICEVVCLRERDSFLNSIAMRVDLYIFNSDYVDVFASGGSSIVWIRRIDRKHDDGIYATYPTGGDILERMIPQSDASNPIVVFLPYPAVVVPLLLISAWLLLCQGRSKNAVVNPQLIPPRRSAD